MDDKLVFLIVGFSYIGVMLTCLHFFAKENRKLKENNYKLQRENAELIFYRNLVKDRLKREETDTLPEAVKETVRIYEQQMNVLTLPSSPLQATNGGGTAYPDLRKM